MHLAKAFYFFYYAALASLLPFLILYYEQLGLTGRQIGILAGIQPLIMLFGAPLWSGVSDATRQHRRVLLIAIGASLLTVWALSNITTYAWLILAVATFALFIAPIMPLVDNSVLDLLGSRRGEYGKQRLWGAVGWGLSAPLVGLLTQQIGLAWAFYGYLVLMLGGLFVAFRFPISQTGFGGNFLHGLYTLLSNRSWLLFLTASFAGGWALAISTHYLFLYLNDLGASRTVMGLALTFATLSEIPILFFADRLLRRWGARGLLAFSLLAGVVRLFAYSFVSLPLVVLFIQLLHGPTFAALWVAGVSYAKASAPQGMGATAQGVFTGVIMGLASALGAVAGGFLYDAVGAFAMFRWAGVGALLGLLLLVPLRERAAPPDA